MAVDITLKAKQSKARSDFSRGIETRPHTGMPSAPSSPRVKDRVGSATDRSLRSKYSSLEIRKSESNRRSSVNASKKTQETGSFFSQAEEERTKDILFLRKMLLMNKKQEILLNKRLAKLMEEEEEEAQSLDEWRGEAQEMSAKPSLIELEMFDATEPTDSKSGHQLLDSPSKTSLNPEKIAAEEKPPLKHSKEKKGASKNTQAKKIQYDLNGRRIYHLGVEDDSKEDSGKSNKHANRPETQRRGSASSKKTFTMKKSVTYINNQNSSTKKPTKAKNKVRRDEGDLISVGNLENSADCLRKRNSGSGGDAKGVQNVVVHCSTVVKNGSAPKGNVKVWNYESLPSLRSNLLANGRCVLPDKIKTKAFDKDRPISVSNNNIKIEINNPPARDENGSNTVETVFRLRNNFSDTN